jgi:GNAT superfamily N-acetyltransferase
MSTVIDHTDGYTTSWEQYQRGEWPYAVTPKNPEEHPDALQRVGLHEFAFEAENGDIYAGCYPRMMVLNARHGDDTGLALGTDGYQNAVAIWQRELFRHIFAGGQTGTGKSTTARNGALQVALQDSGICFIDAGGEDAIGFVRQLPPDRLDDLIYMAPGNEFRKHSIGLNYLDTLHDPGEPGYSRECEEIANNILPMLQADEFARMRGVAKNMLRALIKHDRDNSDYNYTIIDLYYMLATEENRVRYAEMVEQSQLEFLKPFARQIAEMAGDKLEPLLRRLQSWVENDVIRPFIATRDSDFSIADAIANDRILVVRCDLSPVERRMVSAALASKIWTAISARPGTSDREMMQLSDIDPPAFATTTSEPIDEQDHEHEPYYLVVDEFHAVVSENMNVGEMLAMARKKRLGIYILTQQLNQLTSEQQQQILGNCSTILSFDPGRHPTERKALAEGFRDVDPVDLGVGKYTFWTVLTDKHGEDTEPFKTDAMPPFPPVRDIKTAHRAIKRSQQHFGSERLSDQDILAQLPDAFAPAASSTPTSTDTTTARHIKAIYDAAYRTQITQNALGKAVPYEDVVAEWDAITDASLSDNKLANLFETIPDTELARGKHKGERVVQLTTEGIESAGLTQNTGSAENGGGFDHRLVLTKARAAFIILGYDTWLPTQDSNEAADGMADLPIDPFSVRDPIERDALKEKLHDQYPAVADLSPERHVSIEAETSTMRGPEQTLSNLRKAINNARLCVFALKDETFSEQWNTQFDYWRERGEKIIYDTYRDGNQVKIDYSQITCARDIDDDGNRTFYNYKKRHLKIDDGVYALRPNREERSEIRWKEDGEEIVVYDLSDTDANGKPAEYARFNNRQSVAQPTRSSVDAYSEYDEDEGIHVVRTTDGGREEYASKAERKTNWRKLYLPFIPENEFDRPVREDDFTFVVFPDSANQEFDEPQLAARGEFEPFLPADAEMPDVAAVVTPDDEEEEDDDDTDENGEATDSDDVSDGGVNDEDSPTEMEDDAQSDSEPDSDQRDGYDPDTVVETVMTDTALPADRVEPVVAQVGEHVTDLSHEQAVETVTMLLNGGTDAGSPEVDMTPERDETETDDTPAMDEASTSAEETIDVDAPIPLSPVETPPAADATGDESPSDTPVHPAIVPRHNGETDEESMGTSREHPSPEDIETDTEQPASADTTSVTEATETTDRTADTDDNCAEDTTDHPVDESHPLVNPVALTIAEQTDIDQQRAREATVQVLPAFDNPTYLPVVNAVAEMLGVEL